MFTISLPIMDSLRHGAVGQEHDLAQAGRIDGITPAALMLVLAHVKRGGGRRRA